MRIVAFKHFSFDDESALAEWADRSGHGLRVLDPSAVDGFPSLSSFDLLVVLGGPMSVYQEESFPWLAEEKAFVGQCIEEGKLVLGICLGAQMLSEVLGGRAYRSDPARKEIGWHVVRRTEKEHPWLEGLPPEFASFQWHGDTFDLPEGAIRLAYSEACANQAFSHGDNVLALQFHLETTPACIGTMLDVWKSELQTQPYIQPAEAIASQTARSEVSHRLLAGILDRMAASGE